ncbi:baculoviral IAP repeat-containing protein 7-B [Lingula anatina]|uniref:Baculoviral IAP repeat-containing protein 7-B n=1 Tax=Lingula anatina TaxID=7574 RepID=A0A1S3ITG5_LINAN|nr:baculoviral IAP repeat-containing protein 7-B [Lingula anatina]XP_013401492.1 baculoviral IAP repeat-containing protein 7-B [Lingula anatina]|eukprot:XP_013401491.1 baculoviral IAP repeat-containing protein 7-B [Lingula anatina]
MASSGDNVNSLSLNSYFERLQNGLPFAPGEEMQYEALRVSSFKNWPVTAPVGATRLARAGFYYSGEGDRVICFSCNGRLQSWKPGDNPESEHRRHFPTCDYIKGLSNRNVPILTTPAPGAGQAALEEDRGAVGGMSFTVQGGSNSEDKSTNTAQNRAAPDGVRTSVYNNPENSSSDSYYRQSTWARLETFVNWPHSDIHPQTVAEAGFVFTGRTDTVRCVFCQGKMCNFETGDDPMAEHRRHFPLCSFVNQSNLQEDGTTVIANEALLALSEESPIVFERPKNQQFAIEVNRVQSFTDWPRDKSQTPAELAHAGFFYAGYDDKVKCFFCNGGLCNWAQGDDPWVEHARWFPKCGFVKQCKGVDFIRDIQGKGKSSPTKGITMESAMTSPAVRSVLGMGFDVAVIRQILEKMFKEKGPEPPSAEVIIEELFALEEKAKKEDNQMEGTSQQLISDSENLAGSDNDIDDGDDEISVMRRENRDLKERRRCFTSSCTEDATVLFLPCAHITCCKNCAPNERNCPRCSKKIAATVNTFFV